MVEFVVFIMVFMALTVVTLTNYYVNRGDK